MAVCIRAEGIVKSYRTAAGPVPVLNGASLRVSAGDFVSISGPSGAGKSTLLAILGCLDTPDSGSLEIMGRRLPTPTRVCWPGCGQIRLALFFKAII